MVKKETRRSKEAACPVSAMIPCGPEKRFYLTQAEAAMQEAYRDAIELAEHVPYLLVSLGDLIGRMVGDLNNRILQLLKHNPNFIQSNPDADFAQRTGWPVVVNATDPLPRRDRTPRKLKSCWHEAADLVSRLAVGTKSFENIRTQSGTLERDLKNWISDELRERSSTLLIAYYSRQTDPRTGRYLNPDLPKAFELRYSFEDIPRPLNQGTVAYWASRFLKSSDGQKHDRELGRSEAQARAKKFLKRVAAGVDPAPFWDWDARESMHDEMT